MSSSPDQNTTPIQRKEHTRHVATEGDDEVDEYDLRLRKTGCYDEHEALQDCYFRTHDWRECTGEMEAFRVCFAKHQARSSTSG